MKWRAFGNLSTDWTFVPRSVIGHEIRRNFILWWPQLQQIWNYKDSIKERDVYMIGNTYTYRRQCIKYRISITTISHLFPRGACLFFPDSARLKIVRKSCNQRRGRSSILRTQLDFIFCFCHHLALAIFLVKRKDFKEAISGHVRGSLGTPK